MQLERISLSVLHPDPKNARKHSKKNIDEIKRSLKKNGQYRAFVVQRSSNKILIGNGMFTAMKELGWDEGEVFYVDLSDEDAAKLALTDNRTSELAEWDMDMFLANLADMNDLDIPGWDLEELEKLLLPEKEPHDDNFDVDAALEQPVFAKEGDIWQLGRHRVICGDSTLPETYKELLGGVKANLILTDPPYFVDVQNNSGKIKNDNLDDKAALDFLMKTFGNFHEALADDGATYVFYSSSKSRIFYDAYEDSGFKVSCALTWKKDVPTLSRTDWKHVTEPIIYGWKKKGKHHWYGDQKQQTCFEFDRIKNSKKEGFGHPTSKPVPLLAYLLQQSTQTNEVVLDGFLGSASTLIACDQLDRVCYGVELDPKFVSVAVSRYLQSHGGNAENVFVLRGGEKLTYEQAVAAIAPEPEEEDAALPEVQSDG